MSGGEGADTLTGWANLHGGPGRDVLTGSPFSDTVLGGTGDDVLRGGAGDDRLIGDGDGAAKASPDPGGGDDLIDGDDGSDTVLYIGRRAGVRVDLAAATMNAAGGERDRLEDVENITGGLGPDVLIGDSRRNWIEGHPGDDDLRGGGGNDRLVGGAGTDPVDGRGTPRAGASGSERAAHSGGRVSANRLDVAERDLRGWDQSETRWQPRQAKAQEGHTHSPVARSMPFARATHANVCVCHWIIASRSCWMPTATHDSSP